jgi:hypothetical protein
MLDKQERRYLVISVAATVIGALLVAVFRPLRSFLFEPTTFRPIWAILVLLLPVPIVLYLRRKSRVANVGKQPSEAGSEDAALVFREYKQFAERDKKMLKTEIVERDHAIDRLQTEITNCRERYIELEQVQLYGEALARFPPLGEADYSVMVSRVGELRSCIVALRAASYRLWCHVSGWSPLREDYTSESYWYAKLLTERVWLPLDNAVKTFEAFLENSPQTDPRPHLLLVCKKHEILKLWVEHLIKTKEVTVGEVGEWNSAVGEFEDSLAEKFGAPQLRDVRIAVTELRTMFRTRPVDELL